MKRTLLLFALLSVSIYSFSQDKIYKNDGSEIQAKILEVAQTEIKYKKFTNQDGPTYTINKTDVLMIIYANGETEVMNTKKEEVKEKPKSNGNNDYTKNYANYTDSLKYYKELHKYKNIYGKNIFSINLFPFVFKDISVSYQHFFANQKLSFKIPLYFITSPKGFLKNDSTSLRYFQAPATEYGGTYQTTKCALTSGYAIGLHLNIYPTGEGVLRGYIGVGCDYGIFTFTTTITEHYSHTTDVYTYNEKSLYIRPSLYGGLAYQPLKLLTCSLDLGIAYKTYFSANQLPVSLHIGLNVGIRF